MRDCHSVDTPLGPSWICEDDPRRLLTSEISFINHKGPFVTKICSGDVDAFTVIVAGITSGATNYQQSHC